MPQPKNQFLRVFVPVLMALIGLGIVFAVWKNSVAKPPAATQGQPAATTTPPATPEAQPATPPTTAAQTSQPAEAPGSQPLPATSTSTQPGPTPPTGPASGIQYRVEPVTPAPEFAPIGGLDPAGSYRMQVEFSPYGAGIKSLRLADHFETIWKENHVTVQSEHTYTSGGVPLVMVPFNALAIEITPQGGTPKVVGLAGYDVWSAIPGRPGAFEAHILDGNNQRALRIERVFVLPEKELQLTLTQRIENLSSTPMTVRWYQTGPIDLPMDSAGYGGDKRRVRFGYLFDKTRDPSQQQVMSDKFLFERREAEGKHEPEKSLWPNEKSTDNNYALAWTGMTNRYFGVAGFPMVVDPKANASRAWTWVQSVDRILLDTAGQTMGLRLGSAPMPLAAAGSPGSTADLSHMVFAGALSRKELRQNPVTSAAGLTGLVVYNFGGLCANCTFEFMSNTLLWILHTLHDVILHDWALAIVFLVLIVRSCLHPVTRWSQIRMAKFGKQMGAVGPKQKVLQEKYKSDPKKLQEETAKLWREEGISPTGMLGCIPMVLQMPVWVALYAVLFFSVELRHAGGFYGIFQKIQPTTSPFWQFLGDLAEPDRLYYFKSTFTIPVIGSIIGPVHSINLLPLILGVVFFIQQKYLTPPTTATMTPEQEFQQKLMKWMMVILFPVMMYNAPSGLAIYFICNSVFAIIESRWIRSHMDKHGMLDLDKMRAQRAAASGRTSVVDRRGGGAAPVKEGFLARLQRLAAEKQAEAMKMQQRKKK